MHYFLFLIFLSGITASDNSTLEESLEIGNLAKIHENNQINQEITWSDWSPCSRSCGGGISRQQKRCRRKPCKSRPWNIKYKVCNIQPCATPFDFRSNQCSNYDNVPYNDQLLKWYPYYDSSRPCSLICRGEQFNNNKYNKDNNSRSIGNNNMAISSLSNPATARKYTVKEKLLTNVQEYDVDESSIIVQLADKVHDGTNCYPEAEGVCINGECMRVGCDMRIGSNKNQDVCGICGGDGSTCNIKYTWTLESTADCSESCGGGFKIATSVCKSSGVEEKIVDNSKCVLDLKPDKVLLPCNTHPCSTKWLTGKWSECSISCGSGSRNRAVFCIEENGNATRKVPDYKCSINHKPKYEEICNTFSCPMWETGVWSDCSVSCGLGSKRRTVECRHGNGQLSNDCNPLQMPQAEQECRTINIDCSNYEIKESLRQPYPPAPIPEKLIDQPVPSQSTFVADEWSTCSVTCGEGVRHRAVHCKIFLEFSRTIAKLPDHQCTGPKPIETERCLMEPCGLAENSLAYRIDTVGDSSYAESSLTDSFKSSSSAVSGGGISGGYESNVKVAPGSPVRTSYSWKELGYTACSATCLGGVQDLIITCIQDDTGKTVMPLLCTAETKPESRIRVCNDHPCPPRWNTSEFSSCMSPCGLGIQTREVSCIHEVTRGTGNTVAVPNHMCPQPPPVDRQYCNVWDCPVEWHVAEWSKCSKTCSGGIKKRKVTCEQVMAQGRKQSRPERDCPSPKPRSEKECNNRPCDQLNAGIQPIITIKNTTYIQDDPNKKVNLDIGGQATIFQGTPVIKIRCPVKKFDKTHIIWRKDDEELRKSRKHKINKKGALKIVNINFSDSGIYSCWAGQTNAAIHLTVKLKSRDLMSNEEVLRSGNAVHQRQGTHLSSAPINPEPFYGIYGEDNQETHHESQKSPKTTEKPRRKKQKQVGSPLPVESTEKYEYSVTPLHQPIASTASSGASTLMPHFSQIMTTFKNYWSFHDPTLLNSKRANIITHPGNYAQHELSSTLAIDNRLPLSDIDHLEKASPFKSIRERYNLFQSDNIAIPDNVFGPDEERIFIDDDPFEVEEKFLSIEHQDIPVQHMPSVTMLNFKTQPTHIQQQYNNIEVHLDRNQRGTQDEEQIQNKLYEAEELNKTKGKNSPTLQPETTNKKILENFDIEDQDVTVTPIYFITNNSSHSLESISEEYETTAIAIILNETSNDTLNKEMMTTSIITTISTINDTDSLRIEENKERQKHRIDLEIFRVGKKMERTIGIFEMDNQNVTPIILGNERKDHTPTIGSISVFNKAKDDLIFEWVTTDWSGCSQTCGGGGFQMRGAQCTVRAAKSDSNTTQIARRTIIGTSLCEDANYPMPEKVRACGEGKCPQWHSGSWTPCETSRCFDWKTAMQRREISCRLIESEDKIENSTIIDVNKCNEAMRPPQRQECYNDACKGVWRVGEWSECTASCEKDGIKYRILQCVWYGTKKPAGNVCGDTPRPPVMKTCRGPPCSKSSDDCKDHSQLCGRVKLLGMCHMSLYKKQCCKSCNQE
ncbi:PREDICTED: ADAMTS-like protein 1 [Ceratosolen solmsi marchali]|uniref:ADAMTS-like protein 1 n=1 Tax=Ceratosolen solmsi marchali TaxID=326594 RepID=A0AAJ6YFP6_9HYME|nr:PREDICTED: ADAMTS-like protein 1 [Ceratosolen solmsi marchali]